MQHHHLGRPRVPTGYRFTPTPEELIRFYLNPWVAAGHTASLCPGVVCLADIYAADPDELTSRFAGRDHDGSWYFLCLARWKAGNKSGTRRMNRTVHGGGTWHGSSKRRPVGRDGFRQGFEYRAPGNQKTVWIMEELVTNLAAATDAEGVKVICKVYHSPRALAVVEEETGNSNSPKLMMVVNAAPADAGASKRARLLDNGHGLAAAAYYAASTTMAPPPPPEYYAAGTSSQQGGAPESSVTWQQQQESMVTVEQGVHGGGDVINEEPDGDEPLPVVGVDSADMPLPPMDYELLDLTDLYSQPNDEWWDDPNFCCLGNTDDDGEEGAHEPTAAT